MNLTRRIQQVIALGIKGIEGDFIILGMDPDPQCPCHPDSLDAIKVNWIEVSDRDERRAVKDSYDRVVKEFKGWYKT